VKQASMLLHLKTPPFRDAALLE